MRLALTALALLAAAAPLASQATGKFPPDSLLNVKVFPRNTPVAEVTAAMRGFAIGLGVRCQFCHVPEEGMPLERFDFASDEKRPKLVARQMMRMVQEISSVIDAGVRKVDRFLNVVVRRLNRIGVYSENMFGK